MYIFDTFKPSITIPAILNFFLVEFLEKLIYNKVSKELTDKENHKNYKSYENSYVIKR